MTMRPPAPFPALFLLCLLGVAGCEALAPILGPAVTAAGAGIGAYEAQVRGEAAARGVATSDPRVLAAIDQARRADAKAAAESRRRDEEEARRIAEIGAALAELRARPVCPPVADAGAGDGGAR